MRRSARCLQKAIVLGRSSSPILSAACRKQLCTAVLPSSLKNSVRVANNQDTCFRRCIIRTDSLAGSQLTTARQLNAWAIPALCSDRQTTPNTSSPQRTSELGLQSDPGRAGSINRCSIPNVPNSGMQSTLRLLWLKQQAIQQLWIQL